MKLHELKPAPGSRHTRKRVGRGIGSGMGKTPVKVTKVKTLVPAAVFVQDSRVVKTRCIVDCRSVVSTTSSVKNMRL